MGVYRGYTGVYTGIWGYIGVFRVLGFRAVSSQTSYYGPKLGACVLGFGLLLRLPSPDLAKKTKGESQQKGRVFLIIRYLKPWVYG